MINKILKNLLDCVKVISGCTLLIIIIIFWFTTLMLTLLIDTITWCELKLTKTMKKCFGEIKSN